MAKSIYMNQSLAHRNAIATKEKERETDSKFIEKLKKVAEGVRQERDSIQTDLKRIESNF